MFGTDQNFLFLIGKRVAIATALCLAALAASPTATMANEAVRPVPAAWHGGGHWGWHDGRWGWWWIGPAGVWTWYAFNPYYPYYPPYGYPYSPYYGGYPYPPAESNLPLSNMPPPPQYWYYCESAKGYYPHVAACPEGWRPVPAEPEGPTASPAPPGGKKQ